MGKLKKARLRPLPSQRLNDAEALATAAMHGDAGRLVDHQQALVLVHHRQMHLQFRAGDNFLFDAGNPQGRNTQHVAALQPIGNLDAPAIHSHLTTTHDAVEVALGHALALLQQQVIKPLPVSHSR
jgi:hypothetical protein